MTSQSLKKDKNLVKAFKKYQKRYLSIGKKPNIATLLPGDLYHTMRLEGEKISHKLVQSIFKR